MHVSESKKKIFTFKVISEQKQNVDSGKYILDVCNTNKKVCDTSRSYIMNEKSLGCVTVIAR